MEWQFNYLVRVLTTNNKSSSPCALALNSLGYFILVKIAGRSIFIRRFGFFHRLCLSVVPGGTISAETD